MTEDPWDDWQGAARYAAFARDGALYSRLNAELVARANLSSARRVLDVACGTGATARAALAEMPAGSELVGVDGSPAMIALARAEVPDTRARFLVAPAATLARAVAGRFDRALCNAAFWQFPSPTGVLAALRSVLEPAARFVFNVPAQRTERDVTGVGSLQTALARAVEVETGRPFRPRASSVEAAALEAGLHGAGFRLVRRDRVSIPTSEGELLELMSLPPMIVRMAPELDPAARHRVLERVAAAIRADQPATVEWEYWVAADARPAAAGPQVRSRTQ